MEILVHNWYVLFRVETRIHLTAGAEGIPTILFAPVVYFFLADSPGTAKFLNSDDQTTAVERLQARDTTAKNKVHWKQFFAGLTDYQNYVHTAIHFCCNYSFAGLSNFLPTIVNDMGYTSISQTLQGQQNSSTQMTKQLQLSGFKHEIPRPRIKFTGNNSLLVLPTTKTTSIPLSTSAATIPLLGSPTFCPPSSMIWVTPASKHKD